MVIRRKLALLGLFFLLCQLAAALLPLCSFLVLTAGCFAAFFVFCHLRRCFAPLALFLCAVVLVGAQQLSLQRLVLPKLWCERGQDRTLLVRVEQVWECPEEDRVGAKVTVLRSDGNSCRYSAYCASFPYSEPGELVQGIFHVTDLPDDEYRLDHLADGMQLALQYVSDARWMGEASTVSLYIAEFRLALARRIRRYIPFDEGSLLCAMTLGESTGLPEELERLFRRAGVSHLLVVSGLHLTLVCGLLTAPLRNSRLRAAIGLLILPAFAVFTGLSPSVLRAGTALAIGNVGALFGLPVDPFTSLGVAALVLGMLNPYAACDLGLQLSFCATLGVLCAGAVCARLRRYDHQTVIHAVMARILKWILPSFLAACFTLPIQLLRGMEISGVAVLSNLLVLNLAQPILLSGLFSAFCALSVKTAGLLRLFSAVAAFFVRVLVKILTFTASLPIARVLLPKGYTLWVWLTLAILALLFWRSKRYWRLMLRILPVCGAFAVFLGLYMTADLVHIAMLGNASSPCVIAWQKENAVLVFQGGADALNEVRDYLDARHLSLRLAVDLRQDPAANVLARLSCPVISVSEIPVSMQTSRQISDILVESLPTKEGNLARLSVGNVSVVVCSGTVKFAKPLYADIWLLGNSGQYSDIRADCRISSGGLAGGEILYGEGDILEIRPGRSVRKIEVRHVDE